MRRREPLRKEDAARLQELLRVRDLLGVNSFLPRESGTAPSGLPPTRGEATYLILSGTQKGWENDKKSLYNRLKVKIQEEAEIVVGEDGKMGINFQLSEFFPSVRESGLKMNEYSKRFQSLPIWWLIQDRLKWAKAGTDEPQDPIEDFREQTRVALSAFKIMTRHPDTIKFRNASEKKWAKKNARFFEGQLGNFTTYGARSFRRESKRRELRAGDISNTVWATPAKEILLRVELQQFLNFLCQGIFFEEALDAFESDRVRFGWELQKEPENSARSQKKARRPKRGGGE